MNAKQNILIVLSSLGEIECTLELSTMEYAIESFSFPSSDRFIRSDNIQEVARKIGLTKWNLVNPTSAYYVVAKVQVEKLGLSVLQLSVTDTDSDVIYFEWNFEYFAVLPIKYCFPIIEHPKRLNYYPFLIKSS